MYIMIFQSSEVHVGMKKKLHLEIRSLLYQSYSLPLRWILIIGTQGFSNPYTAFNPWVESYVMDKKPVG